MPRKSPYIIELSGQEREVLEAQACRYTLPYRDVVRAKIVLMAAAGLDNDQIGARLDTPPEVVIEVKAIACELPSRLGLPLSRLQVPDIRDEVITRGLVAAISGTTIWRWLATDAIRPWSHRSWIFPRAPDFEARAARVLDLYARQWQGEPLDADDYVISADEKTSIQARCRCHPTLAPAASRAMRVEHEYERGGALAYFAAWDVHQAKLFGRCAPTTGIAPFKRLVAQVMGSEPYASAKRVFWVVDNGSSHRGAASVRRLAADWTRAH